MRDESTAPAPEPPDRQSHYPRVPHRTIDPKRATLFAKFGGMHGIGTVVDIFYNNVLADDRINQFFVDIDMDRLRRHQTAFVAFALGRPEYSGRSMEKAHEGMNLQPEHFDAVVEDLVAALEACGAEKDDINTVVETVSTLRPSILYQ